MANSPQDGHAWFVLHRDLDTPPGFYLDLNLTHIATLSTRPIKYLKYLAWCILCIPGRVRLNNDILADDDQQLQSQQLYFLEPDNPNGMSDQVLIGLVYIISHCSRQTICLRVQLTRSS